MQAHFHHYHIIFLACIFFLVFNPWTLIPSGYECKYIYIMHRRGLIMVNVRFQSQLRAGANFERIYRWIQTVPTHRAGVHHVIETRQYFRERYQSEIRES